jgi:hypothetical protein
MKCPRCDIELVTKYGREVHWDDRDCVEHLQRHLRALRAEVARKDAALEKLLDLMDKWSPDTAIHILHAALAPAAESEFKGVPVTP